MTLINKLLNICNSTLTLSLIYGVVIEFVFRIRKNISVINCSTYFVVLRHTFIIIRPHRLHSVHVMWPIIIMICKFITRTKSSMLESEATRLQMSYVMWSACLCVFGIRVSCTKNG